MSHLRSVRSVWRSGNALTSCYRPAHPFLQTNFGAWARLSGFSRTKQVTQRRVLLFSLGGAACFVTGLYCNYCSGYGRAYCSQTSTQGQPADQHHSFPAITLYEFPACPFCSKVKAFLAYYGIPHHVVSVNPLTRKEVKFSKNKKLPFIVVDGERVRRISLSLSLSPSLPPSLFFS